MGNIQSILISFLLFCTISIPSNAQFDGITFKDSTYVASFTHYFIPMTFNNNDTSRITNFNNIASIKWSSDGRLLTPDSTRYPDGSAVFKHEFSEGGNHNITMEISYSSGVTYYASKTIYVEESIEIPNVFSPDEDGINDVFVVKSTGDRKIQLAVYTRNGDKIFEKTGPVVYWDGKLASGNYASEGVYYYVVKTQNKPEIIKKGFFHLFR
jgi:gliding motility-associated-like protein